MRVKSTPLTIYQPRGQPKAPHLAGRQKTADRLGPVHGPSVSGTSVDYVEAGGRVDDSDTN